MNVAEIIDMSIASDIAGAIAGMGGYAGGRMLRGHPAARLLRNAIKKGMLSIGIPANNLTVTALVSVLPMALYDRFGTAQEATQEALRGLLEDMGEEGGEKAQKGDIVLVTLRRLETSRDVDNALHQRFIRLYSSCFLKPDGTPDHERWAKFNIACSKSSMPKGRLEALLAAMISDAAVFAEIAEAVGFEKKTLSPGEVFSKMEEKVRSFFPEATALNARLVEGVRGASQANIVDALERRHLKPINNEVPQPPNNKFIEKLIKWWRGY